MIKIEFEFQTPEEATLAIQAVAAAGQNKDITPVQPPPTPAVEPVALSPVPVSAAPTYTREQIMTAGAVLIDAGKMNELMALLNTFGVQAVTQLGPEQLGAFATELRKLGAQI